MELTTEATGTLIDTSTTDTSAPSVSPIPVAHPGSDASAPRTRPGMIR